MDHEQHGEQSHLPRFTLVANPAAWEDFLSDESGQDMIEYILVAALIGLVSITAVNGLGAKLSSAYSSLATNVTSDT